MPLPPPHNFRSHLVPDLLAPNLTLIFCGTAPSRASAAAHAYYAKPGNAFWPTLHRLKLTPRLFLPTEYAQLLPLGIGLTDLCKTVSGNDDELPADAIDVAALHQKILHYQPRLLAFTSKHGAQLFLKRKVTYGLQPEKIGRTRIFVLSSTSGRARRFWREEAWQALASQVFYANAHRRTGI